MFLFVLNILNFRGDGNPGGFMDSAGMEEKPAQPVLCCGSGSCVTAVAVVCGCGCGACVAATAGVLRCGVVCGSGDVLRYRRCVAAAALVLWCGWRIAVPGLCVAAADVCGGVVCGAGGCVAAVVVVLWLR